MFKPIMFALSLFGILIAADINSNDTTLIETWTKHDLGYVVDTVKAITYQQCGNRWYFKTTNGETWSDVPPRVVKKN